MVFRSGRWFESRYISRLHNSVHTNSNKIVKLSMPRRAIIGDMQFTVSDLCDANETRITTADPIFRDFGGHRAFAGLITTIRCFEDNSYLKAMLSKSGDGKVLVVDGGASTRCALLGDQVAEAAVRNRWQGIIIHGCIRDSQKIAALDIGVKALAACPKRSVKKNIGEYGINLNFAGVDFIPGHYVYADEDGIIVSADKLV